MSRAMHTSRVIHPSSSSATKVKLNYPELKGTKDQWGWAFPNHPWMVNWFPLTIVTLWIYPRTDRGTEASPQEQG